MESPAPVARLAPAGLDPRRWWALALLCGAFFMVLLDGTITIVALPSIGADLGFSKQDLPWVLSAYALADELRLTIYPVVLGAGERLFGETSDKKPMRLVDIKTIGDGLAFLTYMFVRDA